MSDDLIDGIMQEARDEAARRREAAQRSVENRRRAVDERVRSIEADADARISAEAERLTRTADAAIALTANRSRLRLESRLFRQVEDGVRAALEELRGTTEYRVALEEWIVEAARGLGASSARVQVPGPDREVVASLLPGAGRRLADEFGLDTELVLDGGSLTAGQGVVLSDTSGRRSFSNLVADRMRRFRPVIQRIVYRRVVERSHG